MTMGEERHFFRRVVLMSSGLIIWAAQFTVIYGFNALACARALATASVMGFGLVPVVVVALTAAALASTAAILYLAVRAGKGRDPRREAEGDRDAGFLRYMTVAVGLLSLLAIAWNGVPALLVSPCG